MTLYQRPCDLCGKSMISMYDPACPDKYKVYCQDCWFSDKWGGENFAQKYDFSRPFFSQFKDLQLKVPRQTLINNNAVNSEYCNFADFTKNSYLITMCNYNEDCYYGIWLVENKDCVDTAYCRKCEFCYELIDGINCYEVFHSQLCGDCSHSQYLFDCRNCHDCFGCVGLRNQDHCLFNKKYPEEEYKSKIKGLTTEVIEQEFNKLKLQQIRRNLAGQHNHSATGDHLFNCDNVRQSFDVQEAKDCAYCYDGLRTKDGYDIAGFDTMELGYECISAGWGNAYFFSYYCRTSHNIWYSDSCHSCSDCFGCIGLRHKQYCILNKQYSEAEYNKLKAEIIKQMTAAGEFGESYPIANSPFAYNEPLVFDYYPLSREAVLQKGWRWQEEKVKKVNPELPVCSVCGKNFKIIDQEKKFYQKMNLSDPKKCFKCRHQARLLLRNPRRLYQRKCAKCGAEIETTYAPERPEKVYCEECYRKEIY